LESSALEIGDTSIDTVNRVALWRKAIGYFEDEPFLGIGFRAFAMREGNITHSLFHQVLAEQGLVGFFIFLVFTFTCLHQSYRLLRRFQSRFARGLGLGFFVCTIVHLVGSIGGDMSLYYNLMCVYWLFLGVVARFNLECVNDVNSSGRV
jgi:O-antigen ligase